MPRTDYDLFLCCTAPSRMELAAAMSAALTRRGFRVFLEDRPAGQAAHEGRLRLIEEIPDFVLLVAPDAPGWLTDEPRTARNEIARALATGRNVVRVLLPGEARLPPRDLPPDLVALSKSEAVTYDPMRPLESAATLAHHLSSDGTVDDRRLMRRAKWLFCAAALILLGGIALQEIPALLQRWSRPTLLSPVPRFALYWAGVGQRAGGGRASAFPLAEETAVTASDRLRLMFSTTADGFAYVVRRNARGEVSVLFPTDALRGASHVKAGEEYFAPVGSGWLTMEDDQPGLETIFIIAGYDPLQNLEELVEEPEATTTAQARRALLESTVAGLLDGRHGAAERRVWTGKLHPIDQDLPLPPGPSTARVTLTDGALVTRPFVVQPGLVSAAVEIRLRHSPGLPEPRVSPLRSW